jgi:hypothetical protein
MPMDRSQKTWRSDLALLDREHKLLKKCVSKFKPQDLDRPSHGSKSNARRLIAGIAFHDVYHAGQIQLIKKFLKTEKSR